MRCKEEPGLTPPAKRSFEHSYTCTDGAVHMCVSTHARNVNALVKMKRVLKKENELIVALIVYKHLTKAHASFCFSQHIPQQVDGDDRSRNIAEQ